MNYKTIVSNYLQDVANQKEEKLITYFREDATISWHNTNEKFTVKEFVLANCKYPGAWKIKMDRFEQMENLVISVARVIEMNENISFHVTSFIEFEKNKIISIDEYWGEDGNPPNWRSKMNIGKPIVK